VPYLSVLKYALPFFAGVALTLLWHSNVMRGVQIERLEQSAELVRLQDENQQRIAGIDAKHTAELSAAVAAVPPVTKRVFIGAKCPAVPAADGAGVDNGARAELGADNRQLVYELRVGAVRMKAKLDACQEILK
jgi:hypothetical protein